MKTKRIILMVIKIPVALTDHKHLDDRLDH